MQTVALVNGEFHTLYDGTLHSFDNKPARITKHAMYWYYYGKIHRDNEPAIIYANDNKEWLQFGEWHRQDDLPTHEYKDGTRMWFSGLHLHRLTGPAIELPNGGRRWYVNGQLHGSPAITDDICEHWYHHGQHIKTIFHEWVIL